MTTTYHIEIEHMDGSWHKAEKLAKFVDGAFVYPRFASKAEAAAAIAATYADVLPGSTRIVATFDVVAWMSQHGHTGYASEINEIECVKSETIGEAGRYWQHCEFTQKAIAKLDAEIAEVIQAAQDRYDDWATD